MVDGVCCLCSRVLASNVSVVKADERKSTILQSPNLLKCVEALCSPKPCIEVGQTCSAAVGAMVDRKGKGQPELLVLNLRLDALHLRKVQLSFLCLRNHDGSGRGVNILQASKLL